MKDHRAIPKLFISLGLMALLVGAIFGLLAGIQVIYPSFLKDTIAFNQMRPFHVSTVVGWIILTVIGGLYYYLTSVLNFKLFSTKLMQTHFWIFAICIILIYASYVTGQMGGREYLVFKPIIAIPIILAWALFGINYFKTLVSKIRNWPLYLWMWGTGIVFMTYHLTESYLWTVPFIRENFIQDITIQWKSYGSFVGSWNMLVYGTAIFIMSRIKNDDKGIARGKTAFFFYFLGLTNLMFGWAHHTYFIPTKPWIRIVAYAISMTEWLVFLKMIYSWKKSLIESVKEKYDFSYKFIMATDFWIVFNVFCALLMSIPAIQLITHGTYFTVSHSMGTTIGINTSILLASVMFILQKENNEGMEKSRKLFRYGFWIFNLSLLIFLTCLIIAGLKTGFADSSLLHGDIQQMIRPYLMGFVIAGFGLLIGLMFLVIPLLKQYLSLLRRPSH